MVSFLVVQADLLSDAEQGAAGTYDVTDLLTDQPAAQLTTGEGGAITGYVPIGSLAHRQAAVLQLVPTGG